MNKWINQHLFKEVWKIPSKLLHSLGFGSRSHAPKETIEICYKYLAKLAWMSGKEETIENIQKWKKLLISILTTQNFKPQTSSCYCGTLSLILKLLEMIEKTLGK